MTFLVCVCISIAILMMVLSPITEKAKDCPRHPVFRMSNVGLYSWIPAVIALKIICELQAQSSGAAALLTLSALLSFICWAIFTIASPSSLKAGAFSFATAAVITAALATNGGVTIAFISLALAWCVKYLASAKSLQTSTM